VAASLFGHGVYIYTYIHISSYVGTALSHRRQVNFSLSHGGIRPNERQKTRPCVTSNNLLPAHNFAIILH